MDSPRGCPLYGLTQRVSTLWTHPEDIHLMDSPRGCPLYGLTQRMSTLWTHPEDVHFMDSPRGCPLYSLEMNSPRGRISPTVVFLCKFFTFSTVDRENKRRKKRSSKQNMAGRIVSQFKKLKFPLRIRITCKGMKHTHIYSWSDYADYAVSSVHPDALRTIGNSL